MEENLTAIIEDCKFHYNCPNSYNCKNCDKYISLDDLTRQNERNDVIGKIAGILDSLEFYECDSNCPKRECEKYHDALIYRYKLDEELEKLAKDNSYVPQDYEMGVKKGTRSTLEKILEILDKDITTHM